jgi:hypothetical protein
MYRAIKCGADTTKSDWRCRKKTGDVDEIADDSGLVTNVYLPVAGVRHPIG